MNFNTLMFTKNNNKQDIFGFFFASKFLFLFYIPNLLHKQFKKYIINTLNLTLKLKFNSSK